MSDDRRFALASQQLARMRGMTALYHRQFFSDIKFAIVLIIALFAAGAIWDSSLYLLIPFVALYSAIQTAFDASYLIFARHYAVRLETYLNEEVGHLILVAGEMESSYLFPLNERKIVTAAFGSGFTWFGFVTLAYTGLGVLATIAALVLGWNNVLSTSDELYSGAYLAAFIMAAVTAIGIGWWWFVGGEGERRLTAALEPFGEPI